MRDVLLYGTYDWSKALDVINGILTDIPVYQLSCDMSEEAVKTAYNGMKGV